MSGPMDKNDIIGCLIPDKLKQIVIHVWDSCFFRCKMCYYWQSDEAVTLDIKKYDELFAFLSRFIDRGTTMIFTGGEALSHPQIFELLSAASGHGFWTVLNTNGWLLNERNISGLYDSGLSLLSVSLDGSCPEMHDRIRGMPGSFNRIMAGCRDIKQYYAARGKNILVHATTIVMEDNVDDILNVVQLVQNCRDIDALHIQTINAPPGANLSQDRDWFEKSEFAGLWPKDKSKIIKLYNKLITLRRQGYKIDDSPSRLKMELLYLLYPHLLPAEITCIVFRELFIDQKGNIYHCRIKNEILGNMHTDSLEELWYSEKAISLRQNVLSCQKRCHYLVNCTLEDK